MDTYYSGLKENIGIDPYYTPEERDHDLEQVIENCRPNVTASNFKPFFKNSQNFKKSTEWKTVARGINERAQLQK